LCPQSFGLPAAALAFALYCVRPAEDWPVSDVSDAMAAHLHNEL
jgi:hypothetical protein